MRLSSPLMFNLFYEFCCLFKFSRIRRREIVLDNAKGYLHPLVGTTAIIINILKFMRSEVYLCCHVQDERLRQHPAWGTASPMYLDKYSISLNVIYLY